MSLFDDLCVRYAKWNEEAFSVRVAFMRLPMQLALGMQKYLGSPETFTDTNGAKHKYVSVAAAIWNDATHGFDLSVKDQGLPSVELHTDGRFYFALAVYLESAANSFPKHPFWVLLSVGWVSDELMNIRVHRLDQSVLLKYGNLDEADGMGKVCEIITAVILQDLTSSPFNREQVLSSPAA